MRLLLSAATLAAALFVVPVAVAADAVKVVAAENFYADLATEIGGDHVTVTAILSNPDQDPHLFETSPSTARAVAGAGIVLYNGAGYDPWMETLLAAAPAAGRSVIVAAEVTGHRAGDNPHLWYDPPTFPAVARALAAELTKRDPADAAEFESRLAQFMARWAPVTAMIAEIRATHGGTAVAATEPVFGYMAAALGFTMLDEGFQLAVMNETEPSPRQVAELEESLRSGAAKILFYNPQVTDDTTGRLVQLARDSQVKVIGITETEPAGTTIPEWLLGQLTQIEDALK
jgi:zinc/manganese transport system substrate-binding protein